MASLAQNRRPAAQAAGPAGFHAPLFHGLVAGLGETERHVVLDLGAASTALLALLGRSRSRVEIADVAHFGGIDRLNAAEDDEELRAAADEALPHPVPAEPFDLVFCWDLPNYLGLRALSALMRGIGDRSRPGAVAHMLIYYSERDMPEGPGRFVPLADGEELADCKAGQAVTAAPRYSPEDLDRHLRPFARDRARLLGNGMQEFLFRL